MSADCEPQMTGVVVLAITLNNPVQASVFLVVSLGYPVSGKPSPGNRLIHHILGAESTLSLCRTHVSSSSSFSCQRIEEHGSQVSSGVSVIRHLQRPLASL